MATTHQDLLIEFGNAREAARKLGLDLEIEMGSHSRGTGYAISISDSNVRKGIGRTRAEAAATLRGIALAFRMVQDRPLRLPLKLEEPGLVEAFRRPVGNFADPVSRTLFADPDARSTTRPYEGIPECPEGGTE